ncbi:MAG: BamA/TamA family outer membrane protein [Cyclobacteriaceae bacterium]|nr:BamA/TamA family outer membrane protein [Cyclobacteriaceae bacterium]
MLRKSFLYYSNGPQKGFFSHYLLLLFLISCFAMLNGCIGTRFLKENEKLLTDQKIVGTGRFSLEDLESLYVNKTNKRLPLLPISPYIYIYQSGLKSFKPEKYEKKKVRIKEKYEAKIIKNVGRSKKVAKLRYKMGHETDKQDKNLKEGNLKMRMGEPLAIYDEQKAEETVQKLQAYYHSRGFFNAEVAYEAIPSGQNTVNVVYKVDRKNYYYIDSIYYGVSDTTVLCLLRNSQMESFLQKSNAYKQADIVKERDRINDLMLDNGYYDFSRQLLSFELDTAFLADNKVTIGVIIKNPPGRAQHKLYKIDSVIFTTDADIKGVRASRQTEIYNNISYQYYKKRYVKKLMDWRNFIYPGSLYSKAKTLETQRQFSNLDIYKFININYDTLGGKFVANIFTSPLQKYQTSTEAGVNVSEGYPGPFVNFNLKNRNTFKGLEVMELNGRLGFEGLGGVSRQGNGYSSVEYGANLTFAFPQFLFPFGESFKSNTGEYNPQTLITTGLTFTDRLEYLRSNISSSISYKWQHRRDKIYELKLIDVSYIESDITDQIFLKTLEDFKAQGNNLINSFRNSFVSSSTFSVINNFNEYGNKKQKSAYLSYSVEAGGNLLNLGVKNILDDNIEYFSFVKLRSDYRATVPINSKESFAYRFNVGYALPYGDNRTLPYEKFFFAGGSNSVRAWAPRRLGPGSYSQTDEDGNYSNNFEQQGEIIFESSIEYRHKIFGFVYGAAFIDAGNIWTIRADGSRPGADFSFNRFYKEIAVGTGYGLRFDFNFLLMRFDLGLKLYDPAEATGAKFIGDSGFSDPYYSNYRRMVFNIGIGYPF